ncbi:PLP-dependent aminotransferase family protein [Nitratireductor sp. ZSWI3]|uniref:aminotransferase-like domain-containing protein n=1 Tax=Nitratireductor sp. ZSWI3 TaxID=2966359 RepID=UPI00215042A5|nr:PLP-dependent aminotransferase family protein [Nitratireductor sp. ZSWI3]MCR4265184.1 PLP-dependent aminotransferase family protein [Nitratireductor sp. ZSWI3]
MQEWTPRLRNDGTPRYLMIAEAIAEDIKNGLLKPGMRLPPQRQLAAKLRIDFTTVSRGYTEAQAKGLVRSQVGRGTFIAAGAASTILTDPDRAAGEELVMNMPPEPTDPILIEKMRDGLQYVAANLIPLLRYQSAIGAEKDRIEASSWLSLRGLMAKLERIAVTPGAHATMTAILAMTVERQETVLCEKITYPGIRSIAQRLNVNLVGVDMDGEGILPGALEEAIRRHRPRMLYLNPTLQNPTTITIPTKRRLEISQIISEHRVQLIEDDAYGFVPDRAPAPIAVSAPDLTWYIGGLAKCIGAGLRLAYTVAPSAKHALALEEALRALTVMPSAIPMALATRWIEDGTADLVRRFIRKETAIRQEIAAQALRGLDFRSADNAFNVWLRLPPGGSRADIMAKMAGRHIGIIPSDAFTVGGTPDEYVRLCLGGSIGRAELQAGLAYLAHLLLPDPDF